MINSNLPPRASRYEITWPIVGIVLGGLAVSVIDEFTISPASGIAVWCITMALILILAAWSWGARIGALTAGLCLAVPCFVAASPLTRGLLACFMAVPFFAAASLVCRPPIAGLRHRAAWLLAWPGIHVVKKCPRRFDYRSLGELIAATLLLAGMIAIIKEVKSENIWLPARWLAGGVGLLAMGEMATAAHKFLSAAIGLTLPPLFHSPYRASSVSELWSRRWNLPASEVLRRFCFKPFKNDSAGSAMFFAFLVSRIGHALLAYMMLESLGMAVACGAFFVVQPLLIACERRLAVRLWRSAGRHAWTLGMLAITSPLFVEPLLRIVERSWGQSGHVLWPTVATLVFILSLSSLVALATLLTLPSSLIIDPPSEA